MTTSHNHTSAHNHTGGSAADVHRLLDEAFTGIEMTAERQDLKEEIRANLIARVADLEASGVAPGAAARQAIEELGDVRDVLDGMGPAPDAAGPAWAGHRVRPDPVFLVRTVVLSAVVAAAVAVLVLTETALTVAFGAQVTAVVAVALAAGAVVADALHQETTTNHPMPAGRATGYGAGAVLGLAGLGSGWLYLRSPDLPWLVTGALLVLAGVVLFTYLLGTQTNRHKQWVLRLQASQAGAGDRFSTDPAAAARFGLYTVAIWLTAFAAFAVLTLSVGWAWSWLALVGGLATMMFTLARMQFGQRT